MNVLLPAPDGTWSPHQVLLDFDKSLCYGAIVHYPKTAPFEALRSALNTRFRQHESPDFASYPTMGIWRNNDEGFTIQLSDDGDSYVVIYVRFTEEIVGRKFQEAMEEAIPQMLLDSVKEK